MYGHSMRKLTLNTFVITDWDSISNLIFDRVHFFSSNMNEVRNEMNGRDDSNAYH